MKQNQGMTPADLFQRLRDGPRRVVRSRKNLEHPDADAVNPDTVGKCAAGVDGNAERLRSRVWHAIRNWNARVPPLETEFCRCARRRAPNFFLAIRRKRECEQRSLLHLMRFE